MGYTKFERFFRASGGVDVDRNDMKRYLDFVNRIIYDLRPLPSGWPLTARQSLWLPAGATGSLTWPRRFATRGAPRSSRRRM
jgi:hypothetical protein